ncbi:hypothetical protein J7K24_00605 [bacterium]|nr:hypothetical protein [bacterium]
MSKTTKIILFCLVATIAIGLFATSVLAQPLGGAKPGNQARTVYQSARQQYLKEVNWWKTTRQQFLDARSKYRKFRKAEDKAAYQERAREFLKKTVEVLIKKLETIKVWISNRKALSESEKQSIIAEIDQDIEWLQSKKSGIDTATPDQIKEKAREIRDYWRKHRITVKRIVCKIWAARVNWVIQRFESVSEKIADRIEKLKANGYDTAQLEAWLAEFNQKIELVKSKRDEAKGKCEGITSLENANQLFVQAHQIIKEINQYLRDAHKKLMDIIREMKKMHVSSAPQATPVESGASDTSTE